MTPAVHGAAEQGQRASDVVWRGVMPPGRSATPWRDQQDSGVSNDFREPFRFGIERLLIAEHRKPEGGFGPGLLRGKVFPPNRDAGLGGQCARLHLARVELQWGLRSEFLRHAPKHDAAQLSE